MNLLITRLPLFFCCLLPGIAVSAEPPVVPDDISPQAEVLVPGLKLTLLVEHPDIVTPTGIDVDAQGRIWTVASHTHFRPEPYDGPEKDEVLVFDPDGSNRQVFFTGTEATMDLELGPDGWVYLAERDRVLRIRDADGDGRADQEEEIAMLKTVADYPHNGLSGMAWDENGDLVFALGENFWKNWTLTGTDGTSLKGTGEGGIFRCSPEGKGLHRIAKGFWNPFGVCVREDGEIFAAENDPGSRPPCRILHIVEGGDYGYNRRYGNAPFHPFVAWNGELPGTLPMLHPSGEAPCGILPLGGGLVSGTWSDHRVDFYPLTRRGAGFSTERVSLVSGSEHFRPTCFAEGPDGAIYFTDWTLTFYHLHKRGRIWKLEIDPDQADWLSPTEPEPANEAAKLADQLRDGASDFSLKRLLELARDPNDPFLAQAAVMELSRRDLDDALEWQEADAISALLARHLADPKDEAFVAAALDHPSAKIRFEALRWIANEDLVSFQEQVEALLMRRDLDFAQFEAGLATYNTLKGKADMGVADIGMLMSRIQDPSTPGHIRAFALRLMPPAHSRLKPALLREMLGSEEEALRLEVCRVLAARTDEATLTLVRTHLEREGVRDDEASFLVLRLAADAASHADLLKQVALSPDLTVAAKEAQRALRGLTVEGLPEPPELLNPVVSELDSLLATIQKLDSEPDLAAGERLFFHPRLARCATCHRHSGRGNIVGPDLSAVGERDDREWLLRSILNPQAEVPAQYHPRSITMKDGSTFVGFLLRNGGRSGKEVYRDISGQEVGLLKTEIMERAELELSLMPHGLLNGLSAEDIRDLVAFLEGE